MKSIASGVLFFLLLFHLPYFSFAWGAKGHHIVAEVAFHYLDDSTKARVLRDLGKMSMEEASTWMDDMRENSFYDYMKPWHYINIEKGQTYKPVATDRNILIILNSAMNDINHRDSVKQKQLQEDLYYLFHLIGDFHQPLHDGYGVDRGGNDINVSFRFKTYGTNLHKVWDFEIIDANSITIDSVLALYPSYSAQDITNIQTINLTKWLNESRSYLDEVYNFKDNFIDQAYVDKNAVFIEKQLLFAGLRLAAILKAAYGS